MRQYRDTNCTKCDGVMELMDFTPREWVRVESRKSGVGYRNIKRAIAPTEYWWQCLNDFDHRETATPVS